MTNYRHNKIIYSKEPYGEYRSWVIMDDPNWIINKHDREVSPHVTGKVSKKSSKLNNGIGKLHKESTRFGLDFIKSMLE